MPKKRANIAILEIPTSADKEKFNLHNPENYRRIIWESISSYNHRAQLDIAQIILKEYKSRILTGDSLDSGVMKNLALRFIQQYGESLDSFALTCMCSIAEKHLVFETYMEANNAIVRSFYKRCILEELSDTDILKILGLRDIDKIYLELEQDKVAFREEAQRNVESIRSNLRSFGGIYSKYSHIDKSTDYSPFIKGTTSVKHAFKMLYPSDLAKKIWSIKDTKNPIVFQEIKDIKVVGNEKEVPVITIGSLFKDYEENPVKLFEKMLDDIKHLSSQTKSIANIQLDLMDDQFSSLRLLLESSGIKLKRNSRCFCGSGKKYKKCHLK